MCKCLGKQFWVFLLVFGLSAGAWSAGFSYRYRDDAGELHIGYSVPPEFVVNGYEVLNDRGRVVDVVLPKNILDERASKMLKEAEQRHQVELQRSKDEALLRYYSVPEDVERVRKRKLDEFDNFIEIQKGNIISYKSKVADLQGQAANLERTGQTIPEKILQTLHTLELKIKDAEQAISAKETEKEQVRAAFQEDIKRLKYLLGELG